MRTRVVRTVGTVRVVLIVRWREVVVKAAFVFKCGFRCLVTQNFTQKAAEKATRSYLSTMNLAAGIPDAYNPPDDEEESAEDTSGTANQQRSQAGGAGQTPKVKVMDGERVAFTEEGQPGQYLKLIASGDVDDTMLDALEDFVRRQRKRLQTPKIVQPHTQQ